MLNDDASGDRFCPKCGEPTISGARFCRPCGFDLSEEDAQTDVEQVLVLKMPEAAEVNPSGCLGKLVLGFFLLLLIGVAVPNFPRRHPGTAREKACYANMRVLLGAIEMYNMDHPTMIDSLSGSTEKKLQDGQYLKSALTPPESFCSYGSDGSLTGSGRITCAAHGGVE